MKQRLLCWLILALCASAQTATITGSATITGQATIPPFASMPSNPTITNPGCGTPPCPLPGAASGSAYSFTFTATGGVPSYGWSFATGTLPSGLSLNSSTGVVSGTTSATGTTNLTVKVLDAHGHSATLAVTLTVSSPSSISANLFAAGWNNMSRTPPPPIWCPTDSNNAKGSIVGMRLHDDGVKWGNIETAAGPVFNWNLMDEIVNVLAPGSTQFGGQTPPCAMHIIYTLSSTPQWDTACGTANPSTCLPGPTGSGYGGGTQCSGVTIWGCLPPNDINTDGSGTDNHLQQFISALLMRYPNKIAYYEIWNEPDAPNFWCVITGTPPCGSSAISLARMVRMGWDYYNLVHCLSPTSQVLSPSFHGPTALTWMHNYVTTSVAVPAISIAGCSIAAQTVTGKQTFDITNAHMRGTPNSDPTAFLGAYNSVVSEMTNDGLPTALFNDEFGYVGLAEAANPDIQAAYVAIQYTLNASVGPPAIEQAYWYEWDGTSNNTAGLEGKLPGTAYDQVAGWLIGNTIGPCTISGTIYSCIVTKGAATEKITWDMSKNCNAGCTTATQTETSYTSYFDLSGAQYPVSGTAPVGLKPILLSQSGFTGWTLTSQQPLAPAAYAGNYNSVTTKKLPADILSHCYGNAPCPAGDAIAKCAVTDCGVIDEVSNPTQMGLFQKISPGNGDFGDAFYWAAPTDPLYSITAATPTGAQSITFHAPNQAQYSLGPEAVMTIWDQTTGWVVGLYHFSGVAGTAYTLPNSSGCGPPCPITNTDQSGATNLYTGQDYGYHPNSQASTQIAPAAGMLREQELINNIANHALLFNSDCINATNPFVFPSIASALLVCGTTRAGPQNVNRPSAGTLLFADYTTANLSTICGQPNFPVWQCLILSTISIGGNGGSGGYGMYFSETGGVGYGTWMVGDETFESGQAWRYYFPSTYLTQDPFWAWANGQKGFNGSLTLGPTGCGGTHGGTNPSTYYCTGFFLANIGRIVTPGSTSVDSEGNACGSGSGCYPTGHIHVADQCVAKGYANQSGGCF